MNDNEKKLLSDYLTSQKLMSLATSDGKENLWSANVFFLHDEELNIYFMSAPDTLHSRNIAVNSNVSLTICDSTQDEISEKVGVQISGQCEHMSNEEMLKKIIPLWNEKFSKKPGPVYETIKVNSPFYKIMPVRIKFFNTVVFEEKFKDWNL